eukprot:ANDGO_01425.mRNA.1 hypothetical protein
MESHASVEFLSRLNIYLIVISLFTITFNVLYDISEFATIPDNLRIGFCLVAICGAITLIAVMLYFLQESLLRDTLEKRFVTEEMPCLKLEVHYLIMTGLLVAGLFFYVIVQRIHPWHLVLNAFSTFLLTGVLLLLISGSYSLMTGYEETRLAADIIRWTLFAHAVASLLVNILLSAVSADTARNIFTDDEPGRNLVEVFIEFFNIYDIFVLFATGGGFEPFFSAVEIPSEFVGSPGAMSASGVFNNRFKFSGVFLKSLVKPFIVFLPFTECVFSFTIHSDQDNLSYEFLDVFGGVYIIFVICLLASVIRRPTLKGLLQDRRDDQDTFKDYRSWVTLVVVAICADITANALSLAATVDDNSMGANKDWKESWWMIAIGFEVDILAIVHFFFFSEGLVSNYVKQFLVVRGVARLLFGALTLGSFDASIVAVLISLRNIFNILCIETHLLRHSPETEPA